MAKIQIYSLFTEEYGKNLSPKYQYNPNPRFYTPLYRLLTYNHRVMHPRLFSLYETVFATEQSLIYILFTKTYNRYPTDLLRQYPSVTIQIFMPLQWTIPLWLHTFLPS